MSKHKDQELGTADQAKVWTFSHTSLLLWSPKKGILRERTRQQLRISSASSQPGQPGRSWLLPVLWCSCEGRIGSERAPCGSRSLVPKPGWGTVEAPAAVQALTAHRLSDAGDWKQCNSRSFPQLRQLDDPFCFGKIQQDNFPNFTNRNFLLM